MKAAKTRALHRHAHHGGAAARKPARKATAAPKASAAKKAPVKRTAAQAKAAHNRAWSPGGVSCCSAEAVAASLRLAGWLVPAAEVLALYRRTADGPDAGASLLATLEAAAEHGLAGIRPVSFECVKDPYEIRGFSTPLILGLDLPEAPHAVCLDPSGAVWSWGGLWDMAGEAVIEEAWAVEWLLELPALRKLRLRHQARPDARSTRRVGRGARR